MTPLTVHPVRATRHVRAALTVLAGAVVVLAVVGLGVTVSALRSAGRADSSAVLGVGSVVRTSFGRMWVSDVQRVSPNHDDMGDMDMTGGNMGINDLVPMGSMAVRTTLTFANDKDEQVHVGADQFRLLRLTKDGTKTVEPVRTSLVAAETLRPNSELEAEVTFVVPEDATPLRLSYRDPARHVTRIIDLGGTVPTDPHHNH
jgi:hypothetical protein